MFPPQARCSHLLSHMYDFSPLSFLFKLFDWLIFIRYTVLGRSFELLLHFLLQFYTSYVCSNSVSMTVANFPVSLLLVPQIFYYQDIMQYTSKTALLAVALFGTSVLSLPFAGEAEYVEAREVDNDLSSREFYETHLEARADPSLDARDLKSLDFEARENLDYLKARDVATVCLTE